MPNKNSKISKAYIIIILFISLFLGLMVSTVGTIIFPSLSKIAEPIVGEIRVQLTDYSYKPGQQGTSVSFYLKNEQGTEEDRTFYVGFTMFLIYSFIIFLIFITFRLINIVRSKYVKTVPGVIPEVK